MMTLLVLNGGFTASLLDPVDSEMSYSVTYGVPKGSLGDKDAEQYVRLAAQYMQYALTILKEQNGKDF